MEGSVETAMQANDLHVVTDERKIDQVISELGRYKIDVAALQEMKWFGEAVYRVGESVVLAAGRAVTGTGAVKQRGPAISAWKSAGSHWRAWNSRLVTATLKVGSGRSDCLHVLSCYAPTYAACREEKNEFFDTFPHALSEIPSDECFVVLGDFNTHVGSKVGEGDQWWGVRGPHKHGSLNEAVKELLSFLSINDATVCNTWFEKKAIHKQTWQHPKLKQWHCIDYAIMRRAHRRKCLDVAVVRGAECNTNHMMVRVKLQFGKKIFRSGCAKSGERKFDVSKLKGRCRDERGGEMTKGRFASGVFERMRGMWRCDGSLEQK